MPFARRHPLLAYFVLTFALSWGGVLFVVGAHGFQGETIQSDPLFPLAVAAMLGGPSIAGLLLTGLLDGRPGLRALGSGLFRWRVDVRWYAVALFGAPLVVIATQLALSLVSPAFRPGLFTVSDKGALLLFGITAGVVVGIFEELGWTGFVVPRLLPSYRILTTGVLLGVVWGAWHLLTNAFLSTRATSGDVPLATFLIARSVSLLFGSLPAFRVLMTWVYDRTGSLLLAMLMHASLTTSALILNPSTIAGMDLLIADLASIGAWWLLVAAIGRSQGFGQPHARTT
jgi:membrane protease YdiL (CAAX protease family)